jgi:hypothetical protein
MRARRPLGFRWRPSPFSPGAIGTLRRGLRRLLAGGSLHPSTGEDGLRRTLSAPPSTVGVSFRPSALGCRTCLWRSPTFQMFHMSDTCTSMLRHQGNPQTRWNDIVGKLLQTSFSSITPPLGSESNCGVALLGGRVPPLGPRDTPIFHGKKCVPRPMGSAVQSESNNKIKPRGETFQGWFARSA